MNWYDPAVQVLGDFDPLKLGWIRRFILTCEDDGHDGWCLCVEVQAAYGDKYFVTFRISNVRKLRVAAIDLSFFGFGELFIESLQGRGMENVNYELHDEIGGFSCYCEALEIMRISERKENDAEEVVWPSQRP